MGAVYLIVGIVLVLGVMVLVHEWGHFIVARLCGVRVDVFSIGFGPRLFGWKKRRNGLSRERAAAGRLRAHGGARSFRSGFGRKAADGRAGRINEQAAMAAGADLFRGPGGEPDPTDISSDWTVCIHRRAISSLSG